MKQSKRNDLLDLSDEEITALYLRLSRDDEKEGESNSISNQRKLLTDFAKKNGFRNIKVFIDDGVSGATFNRNGFKELLELIENEMVSTLIVKDMSRLGRNHIEVGKLTDYVFPTHNVRFIAVNDGVDSLKGEDDFTPFRNIMNEWYCKDMSRKMKCTLHLKSKQGYAIGCPPYGYMYAEDRKKWIIDDEAAEVVKRIFSMRLQGDSVNKIAEVLKRDKILIPSMYADRKGLRKAAKKVPLGEYIWHHRTITKILQNPAYVGDVINFKTYSKSFKLKARLENSKENWEVHKNAHENIIDRNDFEKVQTTFGDTKYRKPKHIEKNMFAGFLKCSDCGANLNYKFTHDNPDNHYFSCKNNRVGNGLCKTTHHIRVDMITGVVKNNIAEIVRFANSFEDEFVKLVVDENYKLTCERQKRNQEILQKLLSREKEIDTLIESLFEEKVLGNLTDERFKKLTYKYEDEQLELKEKIKNIKKVVLEDKKHELDVNGFLDIVKKYSQIENLTVDILNEFIDKIIVHHRENIRGETTQKIEIFYKMIGNIKVPRLSRKEETQLIKYFGRATKEKVAIAV